MNFLHRKIPKYEISEKLLGPFLRTKKNTKTNKHRIIARLIVKNNRNRSVQLWLQVGDNFIIKLMDMSHYKFGRGFSSKMFQIIRIRLGLRVQPNLSQKALLCSK